LKIIINNAMFEMDKYSFLPLIIFNYDQHEKSGDIVSKKAILILVISLFVIVSLCLVSILIEPSQDTFELTIRTNKTTYETQEEIVAVAEFKNHSFGIYEGTFHPVIIHILLLLKDKDNPIFTLPAANHLIWPYGVKRVSETFSAGRPESYVVAAYCSVRIDGITYRYHTSVSITVTDVEDQFQD